MSHEHFAAPKLPLMALACAAALSACASTANDTSGGAAPASKLSPPAAAKLVMRVPAIGVQIYKCSVADGKYTWTFVAPEADLFDERGKLIGRHGAGPFWELADGSKVNGTVAQREDAKRPGAIPHLLLATKSTGGEGAIASVKHLQRLNTVGGVAPAAGCVAAQDVDKQARIYYTADYYLFNDG
jgi:Protein of unknown function (DUF3455)